jgi:diacylglycerol kinase (ATP)
MRAAAILGLGCSAKDLKPFQSDDGVEWRMGMPDAGEADAILLFGGDGTIHRHLGQLVKLEVPLLVVPAGSGNDFASSLGLPRVRDSLAAWRKFCGGEMNQRAIDLGTISSGDSPGATALGTRYYCCVAGVGLDGAVAERASRMPRWLRGHGGYALSLAPAIFTFAPFPAKVQIRGGDHDAGQWTTRSDQPTLIAAIANTPLYGGGMKVAPRAQMDDGLLDVCVVAGMDPFRLFCMFPTVYAGRHLSIKEVEYFQAAAVRVETEYPMDVYADGEHVCPTPVEVSVQRGALKVIAPA